ncbi:choice-of-anchor J domain-containing protein [Rugamonas sp. DEMB1]|uniref:choice-of-anchor J domain-containing protein n=1 Tax=Rugamonas sp. DEMB1 TaxID=3039386 RepID=UPI0024494C13|nr:choice-of-anchor J domain-containing protein [Rugamonas sp. DEMB1]WGG48671.1 choice-of-anchor J domain-containing protein [Rugamonas sp. DEMB1]
MLAAVALSLGASASAASLTEDFDGGVPADWVKVNNSDPLGSTDWFQGNPLVFDSHQGAANSYVAANFNAGANVANISDWLILPTQVFNNGDKLSFFSRTADQSFWPDKLEVRFSAVGGNDVGHTSDSVGTFTTLLLTINPGQDRSRIPSSGPSSAPPSTACRAPPAARWRSATWSRTAARTATIPTSSASTPCRSAPCRSRAAI